MGNIIPDMCNIIPDIGNTIPDIGNIIPDMNFFIDTKLVNNKGANSEYITRVKISSRIMI